jgi:MFS family permease
MIGRKYTFLVTILIMGASTFIVGLLPSYTSIGMAAPVILIALRLLQGLALGRRVRRRRDLCRRARAARQARGLHLVDPDHGDAGPVPVAAGDPGRAQLTWARKEFGDWGWRIPFLVSIILLGVSVWIRLSLAEVAGLPEDEVRGQDLQGAADRKSFASGRT